MPAIAYVSYNGAVIICQVSQAAHIKTDRKASFVSLGPAFARVGVIPNDFWPFFKIREG